MNNDVFGNFKFNVGWKANREIKLFDSKYIITINIQAYYEKDGITTEQEQAYLDYLRNEDVILEKAEEMLVNKYANAKSDLKPTTMFIDRDGSYAMLCDDNNDPDEGIAVCLSPDSKIMLQSDFL